MTEMPGWMIAASIPLGIATGYLLFHAGILANRIYKSFKRAVRDVNGPKASPFYGRIKKNIGSTAWLAFCVLMKPIIAAWNISVRRKRK